MPDIAESGVVLRTGGRQDLDAVNQVIERAVLSWDLPERVKRLSLVTYRYGSQDLEHFQLMLAEAADGGLLGVAAWGAAEPGEAPCGARGLLLHGLYVDPAVHGRGIGSRLLAAAEQAAGRGKLDGVLVKAQRGAEGFFLARGFRRLAVEDPRRDYPHRLWKSAHGAGAAPA
jgi:GNAT superfamily N-acetyltransferase